VEFTFLGTSSGVPTLQRNVAALAMHLQSQKGWYLVDCGEGTQHQVLRSPYSLMQLNGIFITHVHGDHCYGLPGLLASTSMAGRTDPLTIVAPKGVEEFVQTTIACTDMKINYDLIFVAVEPLQKNGEDLIFKNHFKVSAHALSHRVPSFAYRFEEIAKDNKLDVDKLRQAGISEGPMWGDIQRNREVQWQGKVINCQDYYLPARQARAIVVGGDNDSPELLADACVGADTLIHEATYTQEVSDKIGPGPQHSTAKGVAEFAQAQGLRNLVLTHFSARYHHPDYKQSISVWALEEEARQFYQGNIFLANDFDRYCLNRESHLSLYQG